MIFSLFDRGITRERGRKPPVVRSCGRLHALTSNSYLYRRVLRRGKTKVLYFLVVSYNCSQLLAIIVHEPFTSFRDTGTCNNVVVLPKEIEKNSKLIT